MLVRETAARALFLPTWLHCFVVNERNNCSYVALHVRAALGWDWAFDSDYKEQGEDKKKKNPASNNADTSLQSNRKPLPASSLNLWLGYKVAQSETTNLFHSPRRVKTDSILDLWRFQRKSVWHIHTQHCHYSEILPSMTICWIFNMSAGVNKHCQFEFGADSFLREAVQVELLLLLLQESNAASWLV